MTNTQIINLTVEIASPKNLAPFGHIIGPHANVKAKDIDFYRGAVAISYPADFSCDHPVDISLASMQKRPAEVRYMERHFQHTQAFIPLGGKPFVAVLAPPCDDDMPDLTASRAFYFDGSVGFCMLRGTWHEFPFALEEDTQLIVLLSNQTGYDLKNKDSKTEEASGPDLDKKDILARSGTLIQFSMEELANGGA